MTGRYSIRLVLSLVFVLLSGCNMLGVVEKSYTRIRILVDGELHKAHGYVVNCSPDGDDHVLKMLSICTPRLSNLKDLNELDWIRIKSVSVQKKSDIQSMDLLEMTLEIDPNNTGCIRQCDLTFHDCMVGNVDGRATVTIRQGKKQ